MGIGIFMRDPVLRGDRMNTAGGRDTFIGAIGHAVLGRHFELIVLLEPDDWSAQDEEWVDAALRCRLTQGGRFYRIREADALRRDALVREAAQEAPDSR